jgi:hypothetical protein
MFVTCVLHDAFVCYFPCRLLQALPIFLDKLVDPITAVVLSVSVVLVIGA